MKRVMLCCATLVALDAAISREALLAALQGRVVASGEIVATFQAPPDAR